MYGRFSDKNFHSSDFDFTFDSTYCYETVDCYGGNAIKFSQKIHNSSDLTFCYNMRNCNECIFCANLRNKSNFIFNKQVTKEQALAKNLKWHDDDKKAFQPQTYKIPNAIAEVKDDILNEVLMCESCGKNYKIIKQELFFYRQNNLPIYCEKCYLDQVD